MQMGGVHMSDVIYQPIPAEVEWIGRRVIACAIRVHRALGPGYKEPIYVEALCLELDAAGLKFEREKSIVVHYNGKIVGRHRLDLLVGGLLVVECKVADAIQKVHVRQVTSYLKATDVRLGFILNFNVDVLMPGGFKRVVL
jgi:GxxExxY protein